MFIPTVLFSRLVHFSRARSGAVSWGLLPSISVKARVSDTKGQHDVLVGKGDLLVLSITEKKHHPIA